MPDLSHLWQRFLLASSLLFGLLIGVVVTVFGYSNLGSVDVHWSIFHLNGVPLWTVPVVPMAVVLVAGTLYHWFNSLHHFTEHMRHRRRVHELEAEVATLRGHLDHVLEMPGEPTSRLPARPSIEETTPVVVATAAAASTPALPAPAASNGGPKSTRRALPRRKVTVNVQSEPEPEPVKAAVESSAVEPEVDMKPEPAAEPIAGA
ncbi:MAG TPA: hypothetical protein VJT78_05305 [Candidatus Dormibacteraeota bacterium]|nr:hypothetical protein [Candidatus Dormibacteraeota bacterium]